MVLTGASVPSALVGTPCNPLTFRSALCPRGSQKCACCRSGMACPCAGRHGPTWDPQPSQCPAPGIAWGLSPASVQLPASPGTPAQPVSGSRHRLGPQPSQCPAPGIERSAHPVCFLGLCTQGRWVGGGDGGLVGLGSGLPCHSAISPQSVVCPLTFYFNAPD